MLPCEQVKTLNLSSPFYVFITYLVEANSYFPLQVWRNDGSKQRSSSAINFLHLHQLGKCGTCAYHNRTRCWQQLVLDHPLESIGVSDPTENLHYTTLFSFSLWLLCFCFEGGLGESYYYCLVMLILEIHWDLTQRPLLLDSSIQKGAD